MVWKEIKIYVADNEQSVIIQPSPELDGICLNSIEEDPNDKRSFVLYMTFEEARSVGEELIKYANDMELKKQNQSQSLKI